MSSWVNQPGMVWTLALGGWVMVSLPVALGLGALVGQGQGSDPRQQLYTGHSANTRR
ncbi:hypothetical protein OG921_13150 [Aldersonia sp. NBC_00410]|uniref:hypothetical protein n=1 Tax=Aldersonia sp. NBC_00410 TaxID=2975954 RepID=UPI002256D1C2|nr:hypothetical protein [Aldersonia sp. NBC_00410]MCX5044112.1 hypothetical protein [Aldersonia sp. NBC_00410]